MKSPAFQFYAHDFLAGRVATYSLDEIGAYTVLLAFDWTLNGLPTRREDLARLLRVSPRKFDVLWARIGEQFDTHDGRYFNPRLQLEREKQRAYSAAMAENGKLGGRPPKTRGLTTAKPSKSTPSPTPSPSSKEQLLSDSPDVQTVLDRHLALHPRRRVGKYDRKTIAAALAMGYSAAELCEALEGNAADEWHVKKGKHELSYVLRDHGKIDSFRAALEANRPKVAVDPVTRLPNTTGLQIIGNRAS